MLEVCTLNFNLSPTQHCIHSSHSVFFIDQYLQSLKSKTVHFGTHWYTSPHLWNKPTYSLCKPNHDHSLSILHSSPFPDSPLSQSSSSSTFSLPVTPPVLHLRLKTYLFYESFQPQTPGRAAFHWFHGHFPFFSSSSFFCVKSIFFSACLPNAES